MRDLLTRGRWWQWGLLHATWFTLGTFVVFSLLDGGPSVARAGGSVVGAVVFGAMMGPLFAWLVRSWERHTPTLVGLSLGERRAATRASRRGPVPTDPAVHRAALESARTGLRQATTMRWFAVAVFALIALVGVANATQSPDRWWWWLLAAVSAVMAVTAWVQPGRLRRRIAVLEAGDPTAGAG